MYSEHNRLANNGTLSKVFSTTSYVNYVVQQGLCQLMQTTAMTALPTPWHWSYLKPQCSNWTNCVNADNDPEYENLPLYWLWWLKGATPENWMTWFRLRECAKETELPPPPGLSPVSPWLQHTKWRSMVHTSSRQSQDWPAILLGDSLWMTQIWSTLTYVPSKLLKQHMSVCRSWWSTGVSCSLLLGECWNQQNAHFIYNHFDGRQMGPGSTIPTKISHPLQLAFRCQMAAWTRLKTFCSTVQLKH